MQSVFAILSVALLLAGSNKAGKGTKAMEPLTPMQQKLDAADKDKSGTAFEKFAESIRAPASRDIQELLKVWVRDPERRHLASIVLGDLGVWTQSALIPEAKKVGPEALADAIYLVGEPHLAARDELAQFLRSLLDDKRELPSKRMPGREETPPPSRVCDEAYLFLRRLLNTQETAESQILARKPFLLLPDPEKDAIIRAAKEKNEWKALWREEE